MIKDAMTIECPVPDDQWTSTVSLRHWSEFASFLPAWPERTAEYLLFLPAAVEDCRLGLEALP